MARDEVVLVNQLFLQGREEGLEDRVIPAITPTAHAANDAALGELALVVLRCVLTTAV